MAKCFQCGYNGGHHPLCGINESQNRLTRLTEERAHLRSALINIMAGVKEQGLGQWIESQLLDAQAALDNASSTTESSTVARVHRAKKKIKTD